MPFGAKVKKLFDKKFYLSPDDYSELILKLDTGSLVRMRDIVAYVDERGSWLD